MKSDREKISDPWMITEFEYSSPEIEILCRFDFYEDGDWEQALRAFLVARDHGLPIPEWTLPEVQREIRSRCGLPVPPRPKGRNARGVAAYQTQMNEQARMAALEAATKCGFRGEEWINQACSALIYEGVPASESTLKNTYKKRKVIQKTRSYPLMVAMFVEVILAQRD